MLLSVNILGLMVSINFMFSVYCYEQGRKEENILFNDALNTFYLRLHGVTHMVNDQSLPREETRCRHMGYSFRLAARVLLYASSHKHDNTYHGLCYTSRGTLAGTGNNSMGPPHEGSYTELHLAVLCLKLTVMLYTVTCISCRSTISCRKVNISLELAFYSTR